MVLFTGIFIGLLVAVPIGPIDIFCIRRTLIWGACSGFITGMGAACADGLYAAFAAFGLVALTTFLIGYKIFFQFLGGLFLCGLGMKNFLVKNLDKSPDPDKNSLPLAFLTTFLLAMMSPMTILSFLGAFAVFGVDFDGSPHFDSAMMLTLGVFVGSTSWWLILSSIVSLCKHKLNIENVFLINRLSGILIFCFGLMAIGMACLGVVNID